jgi:hypothetical protein
MRAPFALGGVCAPGGRHGNHDCYKENYPKSYCHLLEYRFHSILLFGNRSVLGFRRGIVRFPGQLRNGDGVKRGEEQVNL